MNEAQTLNIDIQSFNRYYSSVRQRHSHHRTIQRLMTEQPKQKDLSAIIVYLMSAYKRISLHIDVH